MSPHDDERQRVASEEVQLLLAELRDRNLRFPNRPVFVDDLDVFEMPDGLGFQFRGGEAPVILRGRKIAPVLTFLRAELDGATTLDTLLDACPPEIGAATILRTLLLLHGKGLLLEHNRDGLAADVKSNEVARRQLLYWGRHLDITRSASSPTEIERRLETAEVAVVGTGAFGAATADLLARSGFRRYRVLAWDDDGLLADALDGVPVPPLAVTRLETTAIDPALAQLRAWVPSVDMIVTATCDAPSALFRGINSLALQHRRPWLRANSDGSAIDIGPLVHPFESSCYTCLELRARSTEALAIENELYQAHRAAEREAGRRTVLGEALWPATLAASIVVGEVCRALTGIATATLVDSVLRVIPVTGSVEQNHITRVPRCPDCYRGTIPAHPVDASESIVPAASLPT